MNYHRKKVLHFTFQKIIKPSHDTGSNNDEAQKGQRVPKTPPITIREQGQKVPKLPPDTKKNGT